MTDHSWPWKHDITAAVYLYCYWITAQFSCSWAVSSVDNFGDESLRTIPYQLVVLRYFKSILVVFWCFTNASWYFKPAHSKPTLCLVAWVATYKWNLTTCLFGNDEWETSLWWGLRSLRHHMTYAFCCILSNPASLLKIDSSLSGQAISSVLLAESEPTLEICGFAKIICRQFQANTSSFAGLLH